MPCAIGKKRVAGVVSSVRELKSLKGNVKRLDFKLKSLNTRPTDLVLSREVIEAIRSVANWNLQEMPTVLDLVLPRLSRIGPIEANGKSIVCLPSEKLIKKLDVNSDELAISVKQLALVSGPIKKITVSARPGAYRSVKEPRIDLNQYIRAYAKVTGAEYIEKDVIEDNGISNPDVELVAIKGRTLLSEELKGLVMRAVREQKKMSLVVVRKGHSPITICSDCSDLLACARCQAPLVLYVKADREYICNHCGWHEDADARCKNCGSWKLAALGIGIEKLREELEKLVPDSSLATSGITIDTLSNVDKLTEGVPYSAVVSIDSLFSIPDFSIREKIFYDLNTLRKVTSEKMLVQTRHSGQSVFRYFLERDDEGFRQDELEKRKMLRYPPFMTLIKVTHKGTAPAKQNFINFAKDKFKDYNLVIADAFVPVVAGKHRTHAILRLEPDKWPSPELQKLLKRISAKVAISVNPDNLL